MAKTFVIAEAGSNHENSFERACRLIAVATDCGADACKFQFWSSAQRLAARRNAPELAQVYQQHQMPQDWLVGLKLECDKWGIEFMCTVYLPEDIPVIAPLVKRFKIASFEHADRDLLASVTGQKIVSCGLGALVDDRVDNLGQHDVLMHCTSAYPCPDKEANIRATNVLRSFWEVGFSDHTMNVLSGALAVACGAKYVETHFRLEDTSEAAPDYCVSKSPAQLKQYIDFIRQAEVLLGDGVKKVEECEKPNLKYRVLPFAVAETGS